MSFSIPVLGEHGNVIDNIGVVIGNDILSAAQ